MLKVFRFSSISSNTFPAWKFPACKIFPAREICWKGQLYSHTLFFFVFVYMFVCLFTLQCTKQKTWKDIAAQLGIGASSSGAYTLKKHYGKNLLPFECYYDRGGIDPGPILAQVRQQRSSIILSTNIAEKFCKQEKNV